MRHKIDTIIPIEMMRIRFNTKYFFMETHLSPQHSELLRQCTRKFQTGNQHGLWAMFGTSSPRTWSHVWGMRTQAEKCIHSYGLWLKQQLLFIQESLGLSYKGTVRSNLAQANSIFFASNFLVEPSSFQTTNVANSLDSLSLHSSFDYCLKFTNSTLFCLPFDYH
jgi:hypothetical protein